MMEERPIELTIESAEDLKQVKWSGKMSPYAEAWVYPNYKVTTKACDEGGRNPKWNDRLHLTVAEHHLRDPNTFLTIDIVHHGALGKKMVGTVRIPIQELAKNLKEPQRMSYQVRRPSGRPQGVLNFVVTVGEKREVPHTAMPQQQLKAGKNQPAMAYPVGYPPAGQAYQQGVYPPAGQAYQQGVYPQQYPQYGGYAPNYYAAPPGRYGMQQMPPKRHGGLGMGLGAGLLGGLLLGEALDNDCDYGGGDFGGDFGD